MRSSRGGDAPGTPRAPGLRVAARLPRLFLILGLAPGTGAAQAAGGASPFLPGGHWVLDTLGRLELLGLLEPGVDAVTRSVTVDEAAGALEAARLRATGPSRAWAEGLRTRFREEFPGAAGVRSSPIRAGALAGGWERRRGERRLVPEYGRAPEPVEDVSRWRTDLDLLVSPARALAGAVSVGRAQARWHVREAYAVTGVGKLGVWGGRRLQGYRPGAGGGLVLNGGVAWDGGGVFLREPARLPGVLGHLGPLRFEGFLAPMSRDIPRLDDPWFLGARFRVRPHGRLSLGISRGTIFDASDLDPVHYVYHLPLAQHIRGESRLNNTILSADARLRLSTEGIASTAYVEWGAEDAGRAWRMWPGVLAGVELASRSVPWASLAVEHVGFPRQPEGPGTWYRHHAAGWADGSGQALGHPLEGHGREWRVALRADPGAARARIDASAFRRHRRAGNLAAPDFAGVSRGAALGVLLRWQNDSDLFLRTTVEDGPGWRRSALEVGVSGFFGAHAAYPAIPSRR